MTTANDSERLRRWRLVLGGGEADGVGCQLGAGDLGIDGALSVLYGDPADGNVGMGKSSPQVARWLGDIRRFFPSSVVRVMQKDALERLNLRQMLLQPELLEAVTPDVHLVANLLALRQLLPDRARETARQGCAPGRAACPRR